MTAVEWYGPMERTIIDENIIDKFTNSYDNHRDDDDNDDNNAEGKVQKKN